jgi:predicted N-acetyltransferase YhbS
MFTIRIATPDDVSEIARVVNAAFEVERHMRAHGERTSEQDVRELMQSDMFFVAEQDSRIVGAVLVRITGTIGYFGMLSVAEDLRGSGVGRALRERAEQFCKQRGCTQMTLTTGAFRKELIPYYQRAGYSIVRIEPGPAEWGFNKPFEVLHMAKPL